MHSTGFGDLEQEETSTKLSRIQMIDFVCRMKSEECLSHMHSKLESHIDNKEKLPVNLETSVFCYGLMASALFGEDPEHMEALWDEMQASDNSEYRSRIINSLGCFGDVEALKSLLEKALSPNSEVRLLSGEIFQVIQSVFSGTVEGTEATMEFMTEFSNDTNVRSQTSNFVELLIENLPKRIYDERQLKKVRKF